MATKQTVTFTCARCGKIATKPKRSAGRPLQTLCSKRCRNRANAARSYRPLIDRFWEKVQKTETCWVWTGAKIPQNYGALNVDGVIELAHRLMWKMVCGPIPDGLQVLHHCDNPPCVRLDHLFLGGQRENVKDAIRKNRHPQNWTKERPPSKEVLALAFEARRAKGFRHHRKKPPPSDFMTHLTPPTA